MDKTFVVDTNVILADPDCIFALDGDVAVPMTVLEELDRLKRGSAQARQFIRTLDSLSSGDLLTGDGVSLGEGRGNIRVIGEFGALGLFDADMPDNRIIRTGQSMFGDRVIVTNDFNMRLKARSVGLRADGYTPPPTCEKKPGVAVVEDVPPGILQELFQSAEGVESVLLGLKLCPNEYVILRNGSTSAIAYCDPATGMLRRVLKQDAFGISPRNVEQVMAMNALTRPEVALVALTGKAGTGKTLLALAAAIEARSHYRQILIAKPTITLGKDPGTLPGELSDKLGPAMQSFFDALRTIKHNNGNEAAGKVGKMMEEGKIVVEPLAFIRGRSLERVFLIVDEVQNLDQHEVKTIVSRAGQGTKVVLAGDMRQIDAKGLSLENNGLAHVVRQLGGERLFAHVGLVKGERSPLAELAGDKL